jgi:hypothetical protein
MKKEEFQELLVKLNACESVKELAEGKTWEEFYNSCHRGDWLLWLFVKTNPNDLQLLTLAKGHCANTVLYLMKDKRSLKAVDAAIAFGEGKITRKELEAAADVAAAAAYTDAAAYAATAAADAATAYTDLYADAATYAYTAAYAAATACAAADTDAVKIANQKLTADIVRKYISIDKFNIT